MIVNFFKNKLVRKTIYCLAFSFTFGWINNVYADWPGDCSFIWTYSVSDARSCAYNCATNIYLDEKGALHIEELVGNQEIAYVYNFLHSFYFEGGVKKQVGSTWHPMLVVNKIPDIIIGEEITSCGDLSDPNQGLGPPSPCD